MIHRLACLHVPESVLQHRFVQRVLTDTARLDAAEPVIGTRNTQQPELYGWKGSVPSHQDDHGYVYFLVLSGGAGVVFSGSEQSQLCNGHVYCLDDRVPHGTRQDGVSVALFVGAFPQRCDHAALALLQLGLDALARGDYDAPRSAQSLRSLAEDECFYLHWPSGGGDCTTEVTLLSRRQGEGLDFVPCGVSGCSLPAVQLDHYFPYCDDGCVCVHHAPGVIAESSPDPSADDAWEQGDERPSEPMAR